jgi:hypothetical protein
MHSTTTTSDHNMIKPFYLRLLIASILSFSCGWIDVLGIVRFKLFFAMCTGNLIYFGLSLSPDPIRLAAGVDKSPFLYLCIILCNTVGCFTYHWCINKRQRPLSFSLEGFRLGHRNVCCVNNYNTRNYCICDTIFIQQPRRE